MSRWTAVEWAAGADLAPAPALLADAPDRTLVGGAREAWVLRRGWRAPWTRGGARLWALLTDLQTAQVAAARPVWLATSAFAWMLLARVPTSSEDVSAALCSAAGPPGHRERRRLFVDVRNLVRDAEDAGWPGMAIAAEDLVLAGWPGSRTPLLVGPRVPRSRAGRAARVTPSEALCLTRTDRARLSPRRAIHRHEERRG